MNPLKGLISCIMLWLISINATYAQQGDFVDKDYRIAKFEKDILLYLIQHDQLTKKTDSIKLDDYQELFIVRKQLELFPDKPATGILSDHGTKFWAILTDNEYYFFYDTADIGEVDFVRFKKRYDQKIVTTITFYCDQPTISYGGSLASGIYHDELTFVKYFLHNEYGIDKNKAISAAYFLENITGIKSIRHNKSSSKPNLTEQDYTNWLDWLGHNSLRLYWDDKDKKVKVKK